MSLSRFCVPSQELEHERKPDAPRAPLQVGSCNHRASDIAELYQALRRAPADSEEFELLAAAFNRACSEDPLAVLRALEQQALVA